MEINLLSKERAKLKKLLILTTDVFSLRILSQKIMKLNNRINKLFNINEGLLNEPEEKIKKIKKKMIIIIIIIIFILILLIFQKMKKKIYQFIKK